MRQLLLTPIVLTLGLNISLAQVHIQPVIPTVGLVQKDQLWNLVLVNGTTNSMEGRLDLVLKERLNGTDMLTAVTNRITLPKGSLSVNASSLNPIQYNYQGWQPGRTINRLLPVGAYLACYSFVQLFGNKEERIAEECFPFDVEPLSPPALLFPADSSVQETPPTQFTWTPPVPSGMFSNLRYEVLITEIKPGQKANEAVQQNMSFYNTSDVANNFLNYSGTLPAFEKEKWYGWQVIARDGNNYAGKSEVWVFKTKPPIVPPIEPVSYSYILLQAPGNKGGINYLSSRSLHVKYYSFDKEHDVVIRFLNNGGNVVQEIRKKIVYGDNYFNFSPGNQFVSGQVYSIEITDQQNIKYSALFSINN